MKINAYEKEHLNQLRAGLAECTVLLKSNGDFPLEKPGKIALFGSGARRTVMGGTGSGEVNSRFTVSVERGLELAGFTVTTGAWLDAYDKAADDAHRRFIRDLKKRVAKEHGNIFLEAMGAVMPEPEYSIPTEGEGDTAVYVLARISGEGADRRPIPGDVLLTGTEIRDILAIRRKYKKFMLVLNVGGPVDLEPVKDVENILVLSQLGVGTGVALADILLGKSTPSGKLSTTWTAWGDYPGIGDFGGQNDTRYREGIYVGYRYFDSVGKKPLFPFGFGLSYTSFSVGEAGVSREGSVVSVTACVKNTGSMPGKETVQVYVSVPGVRLDQPYQTLAGFAKSDELLPGQSAQVSLSFDLRDLSSFSEEENAYVLEEGEYLLRIGTSSADTEPFAVLSVEERIFVRKVRESLGRADEPDWKPEEPVNVRIPEGLDVIRVSAEDVPCEEISYERVEEIEPEVQDLSDDELILLNIGSFDPKGIVASVIGSAGQSVAGAAGETTGKLKDKGIDSLVMADGPAGLRLNRKYFVDAKGVHGMEAAIPATLSEIMPAPVTWLTRILARKPKAGDEIREQYATAIPIGTALAQSWNTEFAKLCGDIVGDEMERFGVHLWLAPALNIHRSILCGRNFEYYSEDPLIGGLMAAAVTNGVQRHPRCAATIKHFAANNQEYYRYTNNSIVSGRALREIYLRGFEICIRTSQPHALMTSYNLVNGVHTSERADLIGDVLRSEFGFEGIVMTDWIIAGMGPKNSPHPEARADRISAAGVDLVMPGAQVDFDNIKEALKDGRITREQLEKNASRTLRMIRKLSA